MLVAFEVAFGVVGPVVRRDTTVIVHGRKSKVDVHVPSHTEHDVVFSECNPNLNVIEVLTSDLCPPIVSDTYCAHTGPIYHVTIRFKNDSRF